MPTRAFISQDESPRKMRAREACQQPLGKSRMTPHWKRKTKVAELLESFEIMERAGMLGSAARFDSFFFLFGPPPETGVVSPQQFSGDTGAQHQTEARAPKLCYNTCGIFHVPIFLPITVLE